MAFVIDWNLVWEIGKRFLLFVAGLVVYAVFIFSFYKKVSKKYLFALDLKQYDGSAHVGWKRFWARTVYAFKYVFLVPVLLFFWFLILAALLMLLNGDMVLENALLAGMSLLATIRISAYYDEELSMDLGKILPLALLGIYLLDTTVVDLSVFWQKLLVWTEVATYLGTYFGFTVLLEFILRLYDAIANRE